MKIADSYSSTFTLLLRELSSFKRNDIHEVEKGLTEMMYKMAGWAKGAWCIVQGTRSVPSVTRHVFAIWLICFKVIIRTVLVTKMRRIYEYYQHHSCVRAFAVESCRPLAYMYSPPKIHDRGWRLIVHAGSQKIEGYFERLMFNTLTTQSQNYASYKL